MNTGKDRSMRGAARIKGYRLAGSGLCLCAALLLLAALAPGAAFADAPTCAVCGSAIAGEYVSASGRAYHPDHFRCSGCQGSLEGPYFEEGGRPYCETCYDRLFLLHCRECGAALSGKYAEGADGHPYCLACYDRLFALRCAVCGGTIEGEYFRDHWGNASHPRHAGELPKCFSCGRLVCEALTNGGSRYDDGRVICGICQRTAVADLPEAARLVRKVASFMRSRGVSLEVGSIPLKLVSVKEIEDKYGSGDYRQLGQTHSAVRTTERQGRVVARENTVENISMARGLPAEEFMLVFAHEYLHAWLHLNSSVKMPSNQEESLCTFAAWVWLEGRTDPLAVFNREKLSQRKDAYGMYLPGLEGRLKGESFAAIVMAAARKGSIF